jgi:hypothetical protein
MSPIRSDSCLPFCRDRGRHRRNEGAIQDWDLQRDWRPRAGKLIHQADLVQILIADLDVCPVGHPPATVRICWCSPNEPTSSIATQKDTITSSATLPAKTRALEKQYDWDNSGGILASLVGSEHRLELAQGFGKRWALHARRLLTGVR